MPVQKLKQYLTTNHVNYTSIPHALAYAAREVSHVSHIPEKQLAKTVILNVGSKKIMVVVPANESINFDSLKKSLHESSVTLADEAEFKKLFPDCELGAMPPFGNLYNMEVYVEKNLAKNKDIAFNAGTHTEIIKLAYQDYDRLVHPKMITITH